MNFTDPTPTVKLEVDIPARKLGMILQTQEQEIQRRVQDSVEYALAHYDYQTKVSGIVNAALERAIQDAVDEWMASTPARTMINKLVAKKLQDAIDSIQSEI